MFPCPDMAITSTSTCIARKARKVSTPSMPGNHTSSKTTAGATVRISASASLPSAVEDTMKPASHSMPLKDFTRSSSSSTIKTRPFPMCVSLYYHCAYGIWRYIGKYLSSLGPLDEVFILKEGFETQLGPSCVTIPLGMSALGMTRQRCDGGLQRGIEHSDIAMLQGFDKVAEDVHGTQGHLARG